MIDRDEAMAKVLQHLMPYQQEGDEIVIGDDRVTEEPEFWVFQGVSAKYLLSRRVSDLVIIPPMLVRKVDGELFELPTQYPASHYFDQYR